MAALRPVEDTVWPRPEPVSMTARLSGLIGGQGDRVTRGDAVSIYLTALQSESAPAEAVRRHAERQAEAALALANIAETVVATSANPRMSDVAVLERAIVTLGESRSIYLSALGAVAALDRETRTATANAVNQDLRAAQAALGLQADRLAERVMRENTRAVAERVRDDV